MKSEPYEWPSSSQWRKWSRDERVACSEKLVAQADRQRADMATPGVPTEAQKRATNLLEMAQKG